MHINHITLTTGNSTCNQRDDTTDQTLKTLVPWLEKALSNNMLTEIPEAGGCQAECRNINGALVITIYGPPPQVGKSIPLVTMGIAQDESHAQPLWELLTSIAGKTLLAKIPEEMPWCAVLPYPSLLMVKGVSRWLYDFERCIAWAWVTRNPVIKAV